MKSMMTSSASLRALSLTAAAGANPAGAQQSGLVLTAGTLPNTGFDDADQNMDGKLNKAGYDAATKMHNQQQGG